jgi:hypothetical protein
MKKIAAVVFAGLLGGSLILSTGLARADDDRRDIHNEWRELRRDRQQLEQLRRQRDNEAREGDYGEVRKYNRQIRKLENDMHRDQRQLRWGDVYRYRDRDDYYDND